MFHGACPVKMLMLDTIWEKFEEFCKPQSIKVRARFDLLTSFQQGNKSVDERYNEVQTQVALAKYPPKLPRYFIGTSFGSSLKMKSLSPRQLMIATQTWTSFPQARSGSLQKKMESSKVTAGHIKQVARYPQTVHINLMRHQCTDLPASKYKKRSLS